MRTIPKMIAYAGALLILLGATPVLFAGEYSRGTAENGEQERQDQESKKKSKKKDAKKQNTKKQDAKKKDTKKQNTKEQQTNKQDAKKEDAKKQDENNAQPESDRTRTPDKPGSEKTETPNVSRPQTPVEKNTPPPAEQDNAKPRSGETQQEQPIHRPQDVSRDETRGTAPGTQSRSAVTRPTRKVMPGQQPPGTDVHSRNSEVYGDRPVVRSRDGRFDASRDSRAAGDRAAAGKIRMRRFADGTPRHSVDVAADHYKGGFGHARPDLVRNHYRFVSRTSSNTYVVNRVYLIDNGGRWGRVPTRYSGRNYHFYLSLSDQGYFGVGVSVWGRRHYGDGWDNRFGWSPTIYILSGWERSGVYYYEPCYAFSFTFNHGYERGYIDGFRKGTADWNYGYRYSSYVGGYSGYDTQWGPVDEYSDGYEQGFSQGYYAGYAGLYYGHDNFGYGDFRDYPVVYDFDYDYYDNVSIYGDDYVYEDDYDY